MSNSLNFLGRIERQFLAGMRVLGGGKRVENFLPGCLHVSIFGSTFAEESRTDIIHCDLMQLHDMQLIEGCVSISCAALCAVTKRELFKCINLTN